MKKPKFILKVNQNNTAKVYCGGKWHKFVTELDIIAKPQNILVIITEHKVNKKGCCYIVDGEVASEIKTYFFGNEYLADFVNEGCNEYERETKERIKQSGSE